MAGAHEKEFWLVAAEVPKDYNCNGQGGKTGCRQVDKCLWCAAADWDTEWKPIRDHGMQWAVALEKMRQDPQMGWEAETPTETNGAYEAYLKQAVVAVNNREAFRKAISHAGACWMKKNEQMAVAYGLQLGTHRVEGRRGTAPGELYFQVTVDMGNELYAAALKTWLLPEERNNISNTEKCGDVIEALLSLRYLYNRHPEAMKSFDGIDWFHNKLTANLQEFAKNRDQRSSGPDAKDADQGTASGLFGGQPHADEETAGDEKKEEEAKSGDKAAQDEDADQKDPDEQPKPRKSGKKESKKTKERGTELDELREKNQQLEKEKAVA